MYTIVNNFFFVCVSIIKSNQIKLQYLQEIRMIWVQLRTNYNIYNKVEWFEKGKSGRFE